MYRLVMLIKLVMRVIKHVTVTNNKPSIKVSVKSEKSLHVSATTNQFLYVNGEKIGITGGNEIVPPAPTMDADLLALYLLEKGGN